MISDLLGQWHVLFSDFPLWLKGDKRQPRFTYGRTAKPLQMTDVVSYAQGSRRREIRGIDHWLGGNEFRWRGTGWMFLFSSRWRVDHLSHDRQWAIIAFEKSLVSPSGYDILCRDADPDPSHSEAMQKTFAQLHPGKKLTHLAKVNARD